MLPLFYMVHYLPSTVFSKEKSNSMSGSLGHTGGISRRISLTCISTSYVDDSKGMPSSVSSVISIVIMRLSNGLRIIRGGEGAGLAGTGISTSVSIV